jgi:hypothetical protein
VVERDLAKVDVAGSTPVSRSRFFSSLLRQWTFFGRNANVWAGARYPSGKGEVCKTFMRRFDSDPRLQNFLAVAGLHGCSPHRSSLNSDSRNNLSKSGIRAQRSIPRIHSKPDQSRGIAVGETVFERGQGFVLFP